MKIILIISLLSFSLNGKVLIITHNHNRPDFIELQYKTFKKFLLDEYEYVVFNDAPDEELSEEIDTICAAHSIRCIHVPQEMHAHFYPKDSKQDPPYNIGSLRHANCVQYSLDTIGYDHDGVVFIVDMDIILIHPFSIEAYMHDKDIAGRLSRPHNKAFYFSPMFCMMHMDRLPDKRSLSFDCGTINNVLGDTGGWSYYYLLDHPQLKTTAVRMTFSHQLFLADKHINVEANDSTSDDYKRGFYEHYGFNNTEIDFFLKKPDTFELYLDNHFFHYRGASYTPKDAYKWEIFCEFVEAIMQDSYKPDPFG